MSANLHGAAVRKGLHSLSTRKDEGDEVRAVSAASFLSFFAKTLKEMCSLSNMILLSALSPGSTKRRQEADSRAGK